VRKTEIADSSCEDIVKTVLYLEAILSDLCCRFEGLILTWIFSLLIYWCHRWWGHQVHCAGRVATRV